MTDTTSMDTMDNSITQDVEQPKPGQFKHMLATFDHKRLLGLPVDQAEATLQLLGAKYQFVSIELQEQLVSSGKAPGRYNLWVYAGRISKIVVEGKESASESHYVSSISRTERRMTKDERRELKDKVKRAKAARRIINNQRPPQLKATALSATKFIKGE